MICEIAINGGRLSAVPAVHYRCAFAEIVHKVCAAQATRPKAIAVELGFGAVAAVKSWLHDLGVSPGHHRRLPCMLGLVRHNRIIHPDFKASAIRLQEIHGLPLNRIPTSVLRKELKFSSLSLLCLSATDSIIEAIRSAIEWNIPVYGVDLEEFADCNRAPVMIEDPLTARDNLSAYVERNAKHGMACRDNWVDSRREQFMAGRLRYLVQQHGSVLFTGGLAHWAELDRLLKKPGPITKDAVQPHDAGAYERVLVDPNIAIHQMDLFPDFSQLFEVLRTLPEGVEGQEIDYPKIVFDKLRHKYQSVARGEVAELSARERIADYFGYLGNLCLMNQRAVPDLFLAISAAASMVSKEFAERLAKTLITDAMPWARPEDYPNLRYLRSLPLESSERLLSADSHKAELVGSEGKNGPHFVAGPDRDFPTAPDLSPMLIQLESQLPPPDPDPDADNGEHGPHSWIWPPCENLFYGTAYKAAEIVFTHATQGAVEPFSGALYGGIDSKATARAAARGDDRLYVRIQTPRRTSSPREALTEPFVYIFDRKEAARYISGEWSLTQGGSTLADYIRPTNRQMFNEVRERYGTVFVAGVYLSEKREPESRLSGCNYITGVNLLWGGVAFGNPCLNSIQSARWIEEGLNEHPGDGDFRRCPVLRYGGISYLVDAYKERHGIQLDLENWSETLIRIAIQYARRRVVVIAPDYSAISPRAQMEARSRRISLDLQPLSYFAATRIAAIRRQYLVYPKNSDATEWPEEVIRLLGQKSDAYFELLPPFIRAQTVENG